METTNNTTPVDFPLKWHVNDPAPKEEMDAFWKDLRHFYRTGELPKKQTKRKLTSGIVQLLAPTANYPFKPNEDTAEIEFNVLTHLHIIDHLLTKHQHHNRQQFKDKLYELIQGLQGLLNIEDKETEASVLNTTFDFAQELIAFDKMVDLIPRNATQNIDEVRLQRLQKVLALLNDGIGYFTDLSATVISDKDIMKSFKKHNLFRNTLNLEAEQDAFGQAQNLFNNEVSKFTEFIKAYRIAKLEVDDAYQESIHDEYFDHFTWHRLFDDELRLFHPIVLLVSQSSAFDQLTSLSRLLATNQPIKIIVINDEQVSIPQSQISWEDAAHQFRQELAALAISHRNAFTFQSNLHDPRFVYEGLTKCMKSNAPGLCHLSVPNTASGTLLTTVLAANAGRYFPSMVYDPFVGKFWRGRFDLSANVQCETCWPQLSLVAETSKETEATIDVSFTYADYKASFEQKANELMLVPSAFYSEHLIPLGDYLSLDEKLLYGKIPYIWLKDDDQMLHRAAVPNVWVVSCQERQDFWQFLQDLGGQENSSASVGEQVDAQWEEQKAQLEAKHQLEVAKIQEDAIAHAAERLIAVLLDDEELQLDAMVAPVKSPVKVISNNGQDKKETEEMPTTSSSSAKAWIESENCTTCNECTDKYPSIFKYNDEKQAVIKDPSKGTFAELVKAAENCPAACIHPGEPLNPKEPKLETLIKRAAKFN